MKKLMIRFSGMLLIAASLVLTSCSATQVGMMNADTQLQIRPFDLDITSSRTASATVTRVVGIDFMRLFSVKGANFSRNGVANSYPIPVIGNEVVSPDQFYALHALIEENNGMEYDMVLYPKFERKITSFIVFSITQTTVTAKFAKLKN